MEKIKQTNLVGLMPRQVVVLMIDLQNAFCHPDSHTVNDKISNEAMARRASAFALRASRLGASVLYSRQVMDPGALTARQLHWDETDGICRKGSWDAELYVTPVSGSTVVTKNRFDIWQSREFLAYVEQRDPEGFVICGFELCCCILFAVLGADERGYRYVVPQDLVSGVDTGDSTYNRAVRDYLRYTHGAPDSSENILKEWEAANNCVERTR
jgi:nicotinamidase-related amidase